MKIRRFEKKDLQGFELQNEQKEEFSPDLLCGDHLFTLEADGVVVCIFGYCQIYKGRIAAFSFISRKTGKIMPGLVKKLKMIIEKGMAATGNERIEISVLENFAAGSRMARLLGFEYEGLMLKYYKGKNYKLFARIF